MERDCFAGAGSDRKRGNGLKLRDSRFRLDRRTKVFTVRMVRYCKRLHREVMNAPSLRAFIMLGWALSNMV